MIRGALRLSFVPTRQIPSIPDELHWLFPRIRPFVRLHAASFLCMMVSGLLTLSAPLIIKWLIDTILPLRETRLLLPAVGLLFVSYLGKMLLGSLGNYVMLSAAQKVAFRLRVSLVRHLNTLSSKYFDETPLGKLSYSFKEPVDEIAYFGSDLLPSLLRIIVSSGITLVAMFTLSPGLTLMIIPVIAVFLKARQYFHRKLTAACDETERDRLNASAFLEEHIGAIIPIQLFGQCRRQERRAFVILARAAKSQLIFFETGVWFSAVLFLAIAFSAASVIGYGSMRVVDGSLTVGGLIAFYSLVVQLFEPLASVADLYARAQKAFAGVRQVRATLNLVPSIFNSQEMKPLTPARPHRIEIINLKFAYHPHQCVLLVPSLRINPGESVGITGENGAGKSTLGKLIARLYDVDSGSIRIAGQDVRNIDLECLRRYIAYLPREPVLFSGTLASNFRFVKPSVQDREITEVLELVGLNSLIANSAAKLHQTIGPEGCQLSGGQRQRFAIARIFLLEPKIVILDEATSCLDESSEVSLIRTIRSILTTSTLIVVSHRSSLLAQFERVLVVSGGKVCSDTKPHHPMVPH